jgi:hypothetical protein
VLGFFAYGLPGLDSSVQRLADCEHCGNTSFTWLLDRAHDRGLVERWPVSRNERRTAALWEMLSDRGLRVVVVNWWASWPATAVNGVVVSDRFHASLRPDRTLAATRGLTFPEPLARELIPDVVRPEDLAPDEIAGFFSPSSANRADIATHEPLYAQAGADRERIVTAFHSSDRTYSRIARHLLTGQSWQFAAVYFRGVDVVSHMFGAASSLHSGHRQDPEKVRRYGGALEAAYRYADEQLADLLTLVDPDTNVIVCSDHGFAWEPSGWSHVETAPDGLLLMNGPDVAPGRGRAAVEDVTPTALRLAGLPQADDFDGRVDEAALRPGGLGPELPRIASYGDGAKSIRFKAAGDEEVREQLRALGYVQ